MDATAATDGTGDTDEGGTQVGTDNDCRIYFIEAIGMNLIKIGYTTDLTKRFTGMMTMSPAPLSLLGSIAGGPRREAEIHAALTDFRAHGEWFKKVPEVMAMVETSERANGSDLLNRVAGQRGAALQVYLAKLKAGEVTRSHTRAEQDRPPLCTEGGMTMLETVTWALCPHIRHAECKRCPASVATEYGAGKQVCRGLAEDAARAAVEAILAEPTDIQGHYIP